MLTFGEFVPLFPTELVLHSGTRRGWFIFEVKVTPFDVELLLIARGWMDGWMAVVVVEDVGWQC